MRNLLIYIGVFFYTMCTGLFSQDIHFSMFDISPMSINPAATGNFEGDYRFTGIHRNQWKSVTVPFVTTAVSFDMRSPSKKYKNFHPGIFIMTDKAGDSEFSTTKINPSLAYSTYISKDSAQTLFIGIQSGLTQRSINYNRLRFDNQYNGIGYDKNISSGETFSSNSRWYSDVNMSVQWNYSPQKKYAWQASVSLINIHKPKQSFDDVFGVTLDRRLVTQFYGEYNLSKELSLLPGALHMAQGKYHEIILGSNVKLKTPINRFQVSALYAGAWIRTGDAYFFTIGADYKSVHARISYDINFSDLTPASNRRGGFELGIVYIYKKLLPSNIKYKRCPDFI